MPDSSAIRCCPCCGLAQVVPPVPAGMKACCRRCGDGLVRASVLARSNHRTAAVALAALVLLPFGVGLPMLEVERFGHASSASILGGVRQLLAEGDLVVGGVILLCSVVLPATKLAALLLLSAGGLGLGARHRALTYRVVEWTGRWGMLDVLLVAVLIAALKLGDTVHVHPGPAALAFTTCVILSLVAAACFDPHALWETESIHDDAHAAEA